MKVKYSAQTEAGSTLRIEASVPADVGKMVAWALMSDAADVQPLVEAFQQIKAKEEGVQHA